MPPPLLFDLSKINLRGKSVFDTQAIAQVNPQRFEMQHLDGILWYDKDQFLVLGYKDATDKEFWVRGHIPGRPLMPAVIMIEAAAQLLSFFVKQVYGEKGFIGFTGIETAKFRSAVTPGQRLYLLGHITKFKRGKKYTAEIQGLVDGNMAFETTISGMAI
jgi:3-hydroxyacyl-[acyl-carrier-protein] dehydratase